MGKIKETGNPIVDRIKLQAKLKGKSITFICDKLGVGKAYLSNVVGGSGIIPDERLEVFAQELNTTVEYLKTGKENPPAGYGEGKSEDTILFSAYKAAPKNVQEAIRNLLGLK